MTRHRSSCSGARREAIAGQYGQMFAHKHMAGQKGDEWDQMRRVRHVPMQLCFPSNLSVCVTTSSERVENVQAEAIAPLSKGGSAAPSPSPHPVISYPHPHARGGCSSTDLGNERENNLKSATGVLQVDPSMEKRVLSERMLTRYTSFLLKIP